MIVKFCCTESENFIEFSKLSDGVSINMSCYDSTGDYYTTESCIISKNNLYELIGQLLRFQNDFKKQKS